MATRANSNVGDELAPLDLAAMADAYVASETRTRLALLAMCSKVVGRDPLSTILPPSDEQRVMLIGALRQLLRRLETDVAIVQAALARIEASREPAEYEH